MYSKFTYKVDAMKALQTAVSRSGYTRYISGVVSEKKLKSMLFKMEDRYQINATKQQRWYAKKNGKANSKVILLEEKDSDQVLFWLLVSDGDGVVTQMEKLNDATNKTQRIELTGYELIRVMKASNHGKPTWTWRLKKETLASFEKRIILACRHKNTQKIEQCFYLLETMPVFSEMRQQSFSLFKLLKAEYQRSFRNEFEKTLFKNFYGRFKKATTKEI